MNKIIRILNKGLSMFCISLCSVLVACVVWQVFSRYVLNTPSTTTDEIARFLFIWVGLMGAAYTLGQKRHLAIELFEQMIEHSPRKHAKLRLIIDVISLCFAGIILMYGGLSLVIQTLATGQISPALGIQMGWVYFAIPLCGVFMVIYIIDDVRTNLAVLIGTSLNSSLK
jgi:TRAP-type C4-dicarboxylate transport system permease small subunit